MPVKTASISHFPLCRHSIFLIIYEIPCPVKDIMHSWISFQKDFLQLVPNKKPEIPDEESPVLMIT